MSARLAPAKVNLFLHVGPLRSDGYHPVASLMVFADVGDRLTLEPADHPELVVEGDFAAGLADASPESNLAWRAAQALLRRIGREAAGFRLRLDKALPVAAGLGGGSSDAGAALTLLRDALVPELPDAVLAEIAAELGADGPACLAARPVVGVGRGDALSSAPPLPPLHAVLLNPRVPSPTGAVYRAYDAGPPAQADLPDLDGVADPARLLAVLAEARNDLEAPAAALSPQVAETLAWVRGRPEARLGRLSGSGATVFALVDDGLAAQALAEAAGRERPGWWVRPCRLGGPWEGSGERPDG